MPEPIYTYSAVAFIVGVIVGLGIAKTTLYAAERMARKANSALDEANRKMDQSIQRYQEAITINERTAETVRKVREAL